MATIDREAPLVFLSTAFAPDDWIAVLLKWSQTGRTIQRVGAVGVVSSQRFQAWLRSQNAAHANVFVSVNALAPSQRSRRRDVIQDVRHVFLDVDHDAPDVLRALAGRSDVPPPSYVVQSSHHRVHLLWKVARFTAGDVEMLQKHLAEDVGADRAATAAAQLTRLPGFLNYKYTPPPLVIMQTGSAERIYTPSDFPVPTAVPTHTACGASHTRRRMPDRLRRARAYLAGVPPAITGQHGDARTFRLCCRLARGFALSDDEVLELLAAWNARCQPPWSAGDLARKVRHARRYGREPLGGLLEDRW